MYPIKIVIAHDQSLLCESLAALLATEDSIHISAVAHDSAGLLQLLDRHRPGVVLAGFQESLVTGPEAARLLRDRHPSVAVLGIGRTDDDEGIRQWVEAGAGGFISMATATRRELVEALHTVYRGEKYFSASVHRRLPRILAANPRGAYPTTGEPLTGKELEIMRHICRELSSKQIAPLVGLTRRSVEVYREKIREKTGALNSVGIALYAVKNGIYKG